MRWNDLTALRALAVLAATGCPASRSGSEFMDPQAIAHVLIPMSGGL
ncbi:MAG: hypothetical protein JNK31_02280 [Candidatus Competibacter sp.]|nr:hypothetical protein [Candidatus Competibacter sp.]